MKTLIKVSTVLAGVLAAATSLADQRAMVVDSSAHFYTLHAIPAGLRQLSDDQLCEIQAQGLLSSPFGFRDFNPNDTQHRTGQTKSINSTAGTINGTAKK